MKSSMRIRIYTSSSIFSGKSPHPIHRLPRKSYELNYKSCNRTRELLFQFRELTRLVYQHLLPLQSNLCFSWTFISPLALAKWSWGIKEAALSFFLARIYLYFWTSLVICFNLFLKGRCKQKCNNFLDLLLQLKTLGYIKIKHDLTN